MSTANLPLGLEKVELNSTPLPNNTHAHTRKHTNQYLVGQNTINTQDVDCFNDKIQDAEKIAKLEELQVLCYEDMKLEPKYFS